MTERSNQLAGKVEGRVEEKVGAREKTLHPHLLQLLRQNKTTLKKVSAAQRRNARMQTPQKPSNMQRNSSQ
jgi:hypothetical protein